MEVDKPEESEDSRKEKEERLKEGLVKIGKHLMEIHLKDAVDLAFDITKKYDENNAFG